ncbi:MAG: phage portal protein [Paludibacteraceae bacterium]|nr:phage portal protein [Paludibacteraceae bacterium]
MNNVVKQLQSITRAEEILGAKKFRLLEKAIKSDDPQNMVAASKVISAIQNKVEKPTKAFFIDPLQFNANLGYKDKPYALTYETLRRMSKTPVINAIIKTRKNQVADFAEPQEDKYSAGFIVRRKPKQGVQVEMTAQDKKIAWAITEFLMRGGNVGQWDADDFDTFIRKITEDSLVYDQMTFEIIRNRRGSVESFIATDGSTFRIADSYYAEDYKNPYFEKNGASVWDNREDFGRKINGYYPTFVQVYQSQKVSDFYPWELCFGVRNPSTNIHANGYGCSELEEMINIVTSLLYGDEYNRRFFSQGSAPKGLLRVKGVNNEAALQQFKQQWQSMISGVMQAWKTPVVEADVDWIDLQKNNRDMEYSAWTEYLIKLACAIYNIDPIEIGWDISRGERAGGLNEANQADRLQHSKDKGLYPLLKFIQRKINKYIVEQINPEFEFVFMGLNGMTIAEELDLDIKKISNFQTLNEIREKYDLKPLDDGDIVLNSTYVQSKNQAAMQAGGMFGDGMGNPFDAYEDEEGEDVEEEENPFDAYEEDENGENAMKGDYAQQLTKAIEDFMITEK